MKLKKILAGVAASFIGISMFSTIAPASITATASESSYAMLPNRVDNSTSPCFPLIANQRLLRNCTAFAITYYQYF